MQAPGRDLMHSTRQYRVLAWLVTVNEQRSTGIPVIEAIANKVGTWPTTDAAGYSG